MKDSWMFIRINIYFFNNSLNINKCYILIIPGFGIISHVIGTMSDKSVFGKCNPKNLWKLKTNFLKRTICR